MSTLAQCGKPWNDAQLNQLRFMVGTQSLNIIARKLERTPFAVLRQIHRLHIGGIRGQLHTENMSSAEVQRALGVSHGSVQRWIESGKLKARAVKIYRGKVYVIEEESVLALLRSGLVVSPMLNPADDWREIVNDIKREVESKAISGTDIKRLLCAGETAICRWHKQRGFPDPIFYHGDLHGGFYYSRAAVRAWLNTHPQYWTREARERL